MQAARAVIAADKLKTVARAYREYLASEGKVSAGGVAGLVARVWTSLFAPLTSRANTYRRRDGCITQSAS
jgi:hypothetical protein